MNRPTAFPALAQSLAPLLHAVLRPGLRLTNRLGLTGKATLLALSMLGPIAWLAALDIAATWKTLDEVATRESGAAVLHGAWPLLFETSPFEASSPAAPAWVSAGTAVRQAASLHLTGSWDGLLASLPASSADPAEASRKLRAWLALAAERSRLTFDDQPATGVLSRLALDGLGPGASELAQARADDGRARRGEATSDRDLAALQVHGQRLCLQLQMAKDRIDSLARFDVPVPDTWPEARRATQALCDAYRQWAASDADNPLAAPPPLQARLEAATNATRRLGQDLVSDLRSRLAQRHAQLRARARWSAAATAACVALAAYFFVVFYLGFIGALQALLAKVSAVAAGDLTAAPKVQGRDRLAGMGERLEAMSDRLIGMVAEIRSSAVRVGHAGELVAQDGQSLADSTQALATGLRDSIDDMRRV